MKLDTTTVILMKFSSQEVAKMTIPGAVCDENFVKNDMSVAVSY